MPALFLALYLVGAYPLLRAWWANRQTTLFQALNWALAAWLAWILTLFVADPRGTPGQLDAARYLALCLTGCAGVAVLGARRPHVGAWNFVVLGLLAVMLLPLGEALLANVASLDWLRLLFLSATLAVGLLNYLPTRLAPAAFFLAAGCAGEMVLLVAPASFSVDFPVGYLSRLCLALAPWAGFASWMRGPKPEHELDRLWLDFRDRYGLVWGQRLREQFNRAAVNAGWPFYLSWQRLRRLAPSGPPPVNPDDL